MHMLEHKMTNDILFKMMFVKRRDLLKELVSALLGIAVEALGDFAVTNPEIPPESLGEKFCRLDINMEVNGQRVDLEVQVADEGDYPERSLYYWAREFSSALGEGEHYSSLPRTVVVSIVAFNLFDDFDGCHSEFEVSEVRRGTRLTDKLSLQFFELTKRPAVVSAEDKLSLWLALFAAKTEEDLEKLEVFNVPEINEAVETYRNTVVTPMFKEAARLRERAKHNEASAVHNAEMRGEQRGEQRSDAKWADVVADKDARIAELERLIKG